MNQPKRGRPPILDETKRAQICGVLSVGGGMALAADAVGCCVRTIYNTMERDAKFKAEIKRARAGSEIKLLKCVDDAAMEPRYWRAAAWKLERIRPERYRAQKSGTYTIEHVLTVVDELLTVVQETIDEHTIEPAKSAERTEAAGAHRGSAPADKQAVASGEKTRSAAVPNAHRGSAPADKPPVASSSTPEQTAKAALFNNILDRLKIRMLDRALETDNSIEHLLDYLRLPTKDPPADAA